MSSVCTS